jgi:hypothetical protein
VMVLRRRVGGVAFGAVGFGVDGGGGEVRDVVEEVVFDVVSELVGFDDAEVGRYADGEVALESVSFPANLDAAHGSDAGNCGCLLL